MHILSRYWEEVLCYNHFVMLYILIDLLYYWWYLMNFFVCLFHITPSCRWCSSDQTWRGFCITSISQETIISKEITPRLHSIPKENAACHLQGKQAANKRNAANHSQASRSGATHGQQFLHERQTQIHREVAGGGWWGWPAAHFPRVETQFFFPAC